MKHQGQNIKASAIYNFMPQILADNKYVEGKCKFLKFINECLQFGSNMG